MSQELLHTALLLHIALLENVMPSLSSPLSQTPVTACSSADAIALIWCRAGAGRSGG